jgi:hypothetical protein
MWNTVNSVLTTNNLIWTLLVAFNAAVVRFRSKLSTSAIYVATQQSKTKGVTTDKKTSRDLAIAQGVQISADIQAYAKVSNNNTLFADMNFPKTTLERLPDTTLVTTLQLIHTTTNGNLVALGGYGVTAVLLTAYQTLIGNFNTFVPAPTARKAAKKTATSNLSNVIKDGNSELATMDKLAGNFSTTNPDFVSSYKNSRQIIDAGATQTRVSGKVTDALTGLPISGAQVYNEDGELKATTDSKGKYSARIHIGSHSFRCHADGYADGNVMNFNVKHGQSNTIDFAMIH